MLGGEACQLQRALPLCVSLCFSVSIQVEIIFKVQKLKVSYCLLIAKTTWNRLKKEQYFLSKMLHRLAHPRPAKNISVQTLPSLFLSVIEHDYIRLRGNAQRSIKQSYFTPVLQQ